MPFSPVALLSDIHGNRWALKAVLDDSARRGIRERVNLGDSLYGPLDPAGTAAMLMEMDMPTVSGNEDRILLDDPVRHPDAPSLPFVQSQLRTEHVRWLQKLPLTAVVHEDLFLCHGTPERDDEYLLREVTSNGWRPLPAPAVAGKLLPVVQAIIACGHDHLPALLRLLDGRHVVNPGSVGLPAFKDKLPFPHVMEAGSPHARYSIISMLNSSVAVQNITVPYDWEAAALTAEKNGRSDWALYLRTGRVSR